MAVKIQMSSIYRCPIREWIVILTRIFSLNQTLNDYLSGKLVATNWTGASDKLLKQKV